MAKDGRGTSGRGKKGSTKRGRPDRRENLAARVGRLRAALEELSGRLATAEEMLLAAGHRAIGEAEERTARVLSQLNETGSRIEAEFGAVMAAALEDRPAPRPRTPRGPRAGSAPTASGETAAAPASRPRRPATRGGGASAAPARRRPAASRPAARRPPAAE